MATSDELTPKQRRFAEEYCVDFNATQAAIKAGYAENSAYSTGHRLLKNDEIQAAIAREQDRLTERTRITQDRIMKELSRTGFADMRNFAEWDGESMRFRDSDELSADDSPAIRDVTSTRQYQYSKDGDLVGETVNTQVRLHDKKAALELMGKQIGMFKDRLDIGTPEDTPFVVKVKGLSKEADAGDG